MKYHKFHKWPCLAVFSTQIFLLSLYLHSKVVRGKDLGMKTTFRPGLMTSIGAKILLFLAWNSCIPNLCVAESHLPVDFRISFYTLYSDVTWPNQDAWHAHSHIDFSLLILRRLSIALVSLLMKVSSGHHFFWSKSLLLEPATFILKQKTIKFLLWPF